MRYQFNLYPAPCTLPVLCLYHIKMDMASASGSNKLHPDISYFRAFLMAGLFINKFDLSCFVTLTVRLGTLTFNNCLYWFEKPRVYLILSCIPLLIQNSNSLFQSVQENFYILCFYKYNQGLGANSVKIEKKN